MANSLPLNIQQVSDLSIRSIPKHSRRKLHLLDYSRFTFSSICSFSDLDSAALQANGPKQLGLLESRASSGIRRRKPYLWEEDTLYQGIRMATPAPFPMSIPPLYNRMD